MKYNVSERVEMSITILTHEYTLDDESERDNIVIMIKGKFPSHDIEVTRSGYRVVEMIKNTQAKVEEQVKKLRKVKEQDIWHEEEKPNRKK